MHELQHGLRLCSLGPAFRTSFRAGLMLGERCLLSIIQTAWLGSFGYLSLHEPKFRGQRAVTQRTGTHRQEPSLSQVDWRDCGL